MKVNDIQNVGTSPYVYVRSLLAHRNVRKIANNTELIVNDDSSVSVWFHSTEIVRAYVSGRTILRNGGYETVTTKQRLNAFLPSSVYVSQTAYVWNVWHRTRTDTGGYEHRKLAEFENGMSITFDEYGNLETFDIRPLTETQAKRCHTLALSYVLETSGNGSDDSVRAYLHSDDSLWHQTMMTTVGVSDKATNAIAAMARQMLASGIRGA